MVLLNPGESVLKQANVTRQNPQGPRPGVLTLTNQRLIFEVQLPAGAGGPATRTTIDAPLGRLRNVTVPGGTQLEIELPMQVGVFEIPDAAAWLQAITEARSHAPPAGPPGGGDRGGPGRLFGRGGPGGPGGRAGPGGPGGPGSPAGVGGPRRPPPVALPCRYCGHVNEPATAKCTSCEAVL